VKHEECGAWNAETMASILGVLVLILIMKLRRGYRRQSQTLDASAKANLWHKYSSFQKHKVKTG
jgi:uncharacterized membrane-anchored protein YhcB (DUF1043 family)